MEFSTMNNTSLRGEVPTVLELKFLNKCYGLFMNMFRSGKKKRKKVKSNFVSKGKAGCIGIHGHK
jgi:hypothetical protein